MATNYHVRVYCVEDGAYYETIQVDTIDENWVPTGHAAHTITGFVVIKVEEV